MIDDVVDGLGDVDETLAVAGGGRFGGGIAQLGHLGLPHVDGAGGDEAGLLLVLGVDAVERLADFLGELRRGRRSVDGLDDSGQEHGFWISFWSVIVWVFGPGRQCRRSGLGWVGGVFRFLPFTDSRMAPAAALPRWPCPQGRGRVPAGWHLGGDGLFRLARPLRMDVLFRAADLHRAMPRAVLTVPSGRQPATMNVLRVSSGRFDAKEKPHRLRWGFSVGAGRGGCSGQLYGASTASYSICSASGWPSMMLSGRRPRRRAW